MPTDTKQSLITLRFEGPAFERPDLPANALRELADFQEAFVAVAAEVWRARHSEDAQLPEGFAEALEPRVRSLGAAGAEFGCAAAANGESIATDARDLLLAALREGVAGRCHPDLGWRTLGQLSKLGETLGDNDSLIAYHDEQLPISLDREARATFSDAAESERLAHAATYGDLLELVKQTFGQVPDEVWAESPPLDLWNDEDEDEAESSQ